MVQSNLERQGGKKLLSQSPREFCVVHVFHDVEDRGERHGRVVRIHKVRVAYGKLGNILGELIESFPHCGTDFLREKQKEMGNERVLRWWVQLPSQGRKDLPFHLLNVLGPKLATAEVRQSTKLDLLGVMELDGDVQCRQGSQQSHISIASVP